MLIKILEKPLALNKDKKEKNTIAYNVLNDDQRNNTCKRICRLYLVLFLLVGEDFKYCIGGAYR